MQIFSTPEDALVYLEEDSAVIANLGKDAIYPVTRNSLFRKGVASISHHANPAHREPGGLVIHTAEVVSWVKNLAWGTPLDMKVLLLSAIWHDYGKIFEYRRKEDGSFEKVPEILEKLGHPYCSAMAFKRDWELNPFLKSITGPRAEHIEHCILSHHGRREWGAIKEPATPEALLLHTADMMSARFLPPV